MGSNGDRAFAKPQISDVSTSLQTSDVIFEFMPLNSALGRIRTCAHGSGSVAACGPDQRKHARRDLARARIGRSPVKPPRQTHTLDNQDPVACGLELVDRSC